MANYSDAIERYIRGSSEYLDISGPGSPMYK
jgi:hypothetical protein